MSFLKAARIAENQAWQRRVQMIATDVAVDVLAEDGATADHAARARLAAAVLRGEAAALGALPRVALTNETVRTSATAGDDPTGADVSDSDLVFTMSSIWTNTALALYPSS